MLEINKIHNIDCLKGMKQMEDNSVDCVITSPPYNIGSSDKKYIEYKDNLQEEEYIEWMGKVFAELKRVLKEDGTIWFNFGYSQKTQTLPYKICLEAVEKGLQLRETMCWDKKTGMPITTGKHMTRVWEFVWLFSKTDKYKVYKKFLGVTNNCKYYKPIYNIIRTKPEMGGKDITKIHHARYPESLVHHILKIATKRDDLVLDPFMGSGTTASVAQQEGMNFIGFEIVESYIESANKRLNQKSLAKFFGNPHQKQ